MGKVIAAIAVVVGGSLWCSAASSIGIYSHGPGKLLSRADWPSGLDKLVNEWDWFRGHHVVPNDYLYYSGDTDRFNEFLEQYASIQDAPLTVVLHPGRGTTGGLVSLGGGKRVPFDWRLVIKRTLSSHRETPEAPAEKGSPYVPTVHLWLGGQIQLGRLSVPLNVDLKSGDEIERFIAEHEAKQRGEAVRTRPELEARATRDE